MTGATGGVRFFVTTSLVIARATLLETARRKLIVALSIITFVVALLSAWLFHHITNNALDGVPTEFVDIIVSQLLVFIAFAFSCVLALTGAFMAAPAIGSEIESGIALAIVSRPIPRATIILGKWLGLALLLLVYTIGAGVAELAILKWTTDYLPPDPSALIMYLAAVGIVVMTLGLCLSTRMGTMAAGIIVIVVFFASWMLGIAGGVGEAIHNDGLKTTASVAHVIFPSDGLWRGALYAMNNPDVTFISGAAGIPGPDGQITDPNPFLASAPPDGSYVVWCGAWVLLILGLTLFSFRRREI